MDKHAQERNGLLACYEKLPRNTQLIAQACALMGEPFRTKHLLACLLTETTEKTVGPDFSEPQVIESLATLINQDLLLADDNELQINPLLLESVARKSSGSPFAEALAPRIRQTRPASELSDKTGITTIWRRGLRDLRLALYTNDETAYNLCLLRLLDLQEQNPQHHLENPMVSLCSTPFAPDWFSTLPLHIQLYALHQILVVSLQNLAACAEVIDYLQSDALARQLSPASRSSFQYLLISNLLIRGQTAEAANLLGAMQDPPPLGLAAWLDFLCDRNDSAIHLFEKDLLEIRRINKNKEAYFTGPEGLFYLLALLKNGNYANHEPIRSIVFDIEKIQPHNLFLAPYRMIVAVVEARENRIDLAHERLMSVGRIGKPDSLTALFFALASYWIEGAPTKNIVPRLKHFLVCAQTNGYDWLGREFELLLSAADKKNRLPHWGSSAGRTPVSLFPLIKPEEQWQRALRALNYTSATSLADSAERFRLVWMIACDKNGKNMEITPKVQSLGSKGFWTKGRTISLKKLYARKRPSFLSEQDLGLCKTLHEYRDNRGIHYRFDLARMLQLLTGHPNVFLTESPKTPVEVLAAEPELRVDHKADNLHVSFFPELNETETVVIRETPTRFRIFTITDEHRRVASIIGPEGLIVPKDGKDDLFAILGNISSFMTVHSTIDGYSLGVDEVVADPRTHLQLLPYGSGFRLAMLVKPLAPHGPYQKPGEGPKNIIAQVNGKRVQARRDLALEEANARKVEDFCPSLGSSQELEREWILQDPEESLQLLVELQQLPGDVVVEWPEGEKLTVSPPARLNQFHLGIRQQNNWFELTGKLQLDENLVLDMRKLLELARSTESRFIPLGQGHFLSLTRELKKRLDEINTFAELRKTSIRFHPLASLALDDFTAEVGHLDTDDNWQRQKEKLLAAQEYVPQIPSTLQAELRDYQIDGFNWLSRLAYWGVGACLADDMGLGKTIQALALILSRAQDGPTLVVAPTSVCFNWQEEIQRFAPTLNVILFGGRNRKKLITGAGPFDLVVCSYGLLQQEVELLTSRTWHTIILDEAQAIKNFITKRSRAAMRLEGRFKLITTGTPIENHLPELWNLFQFINPGLLGSLTQFNKRFALPIERYNDGEAKKKLKKLVNPFILRRIKSQVLEELPARTEIVLQVEMSPKEAAFYEALRQRAVENLSKSEVQAGKRSMQILAEIMRLRRACCNPRLVAPDSPIASAKLDLFGKVVEELLENRHKALVFSQFVGHLALIREFLDQKGISYRYIDGNTPAKERQSQVNSFQAGQGDLFLISLKAGGLGLNLTAADYVIHMDPWWNPAVEDQASDRAHRIGQQHPVTIYRLVVKNTIEEKIVRLHQEKRELADSLLEGTDISSAMSAADLLRLLKEY